MGLSQNNANYPKLPWLIIVLRAIFMGIHILRHYHFLQGSSFSSSGCIAFHLPQSHTWWAPCSTPLVLGHRADFEILVLSWYVAQRCTGATGYVWVTRSSQVCWVSGLLDMLILFTQCMTELLSYLMSFLSYEFRDRMPNVFSD